VWRANGSVALMQVRIVEACTGLLSVMPGTKYCFGSTQWTCIHQFPIHAASMLTCRTEVSATASGIALDFVARCSGSPCTTRRVAVVHHCHQHSHLLTYPAARLDACMKDAHLDNCYQRQTSPVALHRPPSTPIRAYYRTVHMAHPGVLVFEPYSFPW
jgi:hypothetical protein